MTELNSREAESVSVTILGDNYTDLFLLESRGIMRRPPLPSGMTPVTVKEMKRLEPDYVIPMHCTGWKATNIFACEMPDQFFLNTVGTAYMFG